MVGFYGINVGKYTVRPMDPMGFLSFNFENRIHLIPKVFFQYTSLFFSPEIELKGRYPCTIRKILVLLSQYP